MFICTFVMENLYFPLISYVENNKEDEKNFFYKKKNGNERLIKDSNNPGNQDNYFNFIF